MPTCSDCYPQGVARDATTPRFIKESPSATASTAAPAQGAAPPEAQGPGAHGDELAGRKLENEVEAGSIPTTSRVSAMILQVGPTGSVVKSSISAGDSDGYLSSPGRRRRMRVRRGVDPSPTDLAVVTCIGGCAACHEDINPRQWGRTPPCFVAKPYLLVYATLYPFPPVPPPGRAG
jgi:hypothetical protein